MKTTGSSPGIGRLLHEILVHRAKRWPRGRSLHRQLVGALDDNPAQFDQLIGRVARELETNPRREIFLQFLRDDRQLRDEEMADLVEYLYSSIVNNFKGELAELLSRPVLCRFSARLGGGEIIAGWDVAEPQLRLVAGKPSWRKGADALIVRNEGGRLIIVAVAEINPTAPRPRGCRCRSRNTSQGCRRACVSAGARFQRRSTRFSRRPARWRRSPSALPRSNDTARRSPAGGKR